MASNNGANSGLVDLTTSWTETTVEDGRKRATMALTGEGESIDALVAPLTSKITIGQRPLAYRWSVNINEVETASGLVATYDMGRMSAQFMIAAYMVKYSA